LVGLVGLGLPLLLRLGLVGLELWLVSEIALNKYCCEYGKVFRISTVLYNWLISAHASQAFSIAHCTDSEDLPEYGTLNSLFAYCCSYFT